MRFLIIILFVPSVSFAKKIEVADLNYTTTCTSTALVTTEVVNEDGETKTEFERIEKKLEIISSKEDSDIKNSITFTHDIGDSFDFTLEFKNLRDIKRLDKKQKKRLQKQGTDKLHPFFISFKYNKADTLMYPEDGVSEFPVMMTRSPASLGGIGTNLRHKFRISANSHVYFQVYCNNVKEIKPEPIVEQKDNVTEKQKPEDKENIDILF